MNKAEVLEIKRQFTPDRCTVDRICGCYVDHEKNKRLTFRKAFGSIPEEEMFKYLDIFSHTLSGAVGKSLISLSFPVEEEEEGGAQSFLMDLRDSHLADDGLTEELFDRIIDNYVNGENYYIVLVHAMYDVPGRTSDGMELEDASDNVYDYILCSICPVKLSKAGLGYNEQDNVIEERYRDWVVEPPVKGFLFPAFMDRTADIHNVLYYTKKADDIQPALVQSLFGGVAPMSAPEQRDVFRGVIEDTAGETGDFRLIKEIHENLSVMMSDHADDPEPLALSREDVRILLTDCGVPEEKMEGFDRSWRENTGGEDYPLLASNIIGTGRFDIEMPDVVVKVRPDRTDLVETKVIDGRQCLVIEINGRVEVNGVSVKA